MAVGGLTQTIGELHAFAATLASAPELVLTADESHRLATALTEVQRHFPVRPLNPKYISLATLVYVAVTVYKPRVAAIVARNRAAPEALPTVQATAPSPGHYAAPDTPPETPGNTWFGTA